VLQCHCLRRIPELWKPTLMRRILLTCLAILVLAGCQRDWTTLVDTEPSPTLDTPLMERNDAADAEEWPAIPEQDVKTDWLIGKVIRVADGDTLTLLVDEKDAPKEIRVRLEGIDCPEAGQPWGTRAKQALSELVFQQTVKVWSIGQDRYGRTLGRVYVGEDDERSDVNLALVAQGLAWHYKRYSDDELLADAEIAAKRERRGLWADPSPVAPWHWRAKQPKGKSEGPAFTPPADGKHWLNTTTGVRHNSTCENWGKTKRGRPCGPKEGKACGMCGG